MIRFFIAFAFFAPLFNFANNNYALAQYENKQEEQEGKPLEVKNKLCPVTLEKITSGDKFTYTYEGKTYRFSSREAIEEFKKGPEKYLEIWEKKEKFYKINVLYD